MYRKFGHRGAPGKPRYGENTLTSFNKALEMGADALEFDVRCTKDRELIVIHDLAVDRTTDGHGNVCDLSYAQIKGFDAGYGESVPLLEEVLDYFGGHCLLNVELKENGLASRVREMVLDRNIQSSVVVSAFDTDDNDPDSSSSWDDLYEFSGVIPTALLATEAKIQKMGEWEYVEATVFHEATAIHPGAKVTTSNLIFLAHSMKLYVNVWTVNQQRQIKKFKAMGVDGLFSDFPDRL